MLPKIKVDVKSYAPSGKLVSEYLENFENF